MSFSPCEFFDAWLSRYMQVDEYVRLLHECETIEEFCHECGDARQTERIIGDDPTIETQLNYDRREIVGAPFTNLDCC